MAACPSYTSSPMGDESQTPSGAKKLVIASTSPLSPASIRRRTSSTRSGVVDSSGISLRPLLGKAFGGSTGLVDVGVARHPHNPAICPELNPSPLLFNPPVAAHQATVFPEGDEYHAVAKIESILHLDLIVLPRPPPVPKEASNR